MNFKNSIFLKVTALNLFFVTLYSCSGSGGQGSGGTAAITTYTKITCSNATKIENCWESIQSSTQSCFFYVPSYSSGVYGTFNGSKSQCSLGTKTVDFSPAYSSAGLFSSSSNSTLTFYNNGSYCGSFTYKPSGGFALENSLFQKFDATATASEYYITCGGINYFATEEDFQVMDNDCPTALNVFWYGYSQSGSAGNYSNPSFRIGNKAMSSAQSIVCQ